MKRARAGDGAGLVVFGVRSAAMEPAPERVARAIVDHYRAARREMPWRKTRDPYAIWVSEIMLQQTRVATVIPYYERWLQRFPTVRALAEAPIDDVLASWAGLGYYRRARNLHAGAREVVARYGGELPRTADGLRALPGVGRYTAGAIASIAHGERAAVVDGNVLRVLARVYAIDDDIKGTQAQRRVWELAEAMVPGDAPGDFNQGVMELGATVCTPTSPSCLVCPLAKLCRAAATGRQGELPVTRPRKRADELPLIDEAAAWVVRRGAVLIVRRVPGGLYGGMWELPQAAAPAALGDAVGLALQLVDGAPTAEHEQTLSHRRLRLRVYRARAERGRVKPDPARYDAFRWQPEAALGELALSSATKQVVRKHQMRSKQSP